MFSYIDRRTSGLVEIIPGLLTQQLEIMKALNKTTEAVATKLAALEMRVGSLEAHGE